MNDIAVVVIGRNEGERLVACLKSLITQLCDGGLVVYVDSGSTDRSCQVARDFNVAVIELDTSISFTAARARNSGWTWLCKNHPYIKYVQFIDGDCELAPSWLGHARTELENNPKLAVVCGRRRERLPEASPYNRLADMEWNTPVGEASACGGDALIRMEAIQSVNGYNPALICGEEPEMCLRLRRQGWQVRRIDAEMTLHDAAMHHFGQWWKRSVRGGWAVAEGYAIYGSAPERYMKREYFSGFLWGLVLPCLALGGAWFTYGLSLLLLIVYPILTVRIYRFRREEYGDSPSHAALYAIFCTLSKLPQAIGQSSYWINRWRGKSATLIEYKVPATKGV